MALSIVHNAGASVANRLLEENGARLTRSIAQLSAGSRVLAARDDAAALAIGSRLSAEMASLKQAAINAGQAATMLQIADGAAASIDTILVRMKTLAIQSASDQISGVERAMLNTEYQSLVNELDRISKVTKFNGRSLLRGDTEKGVIYTIRSLPAKGVVELDGKALGLGDTFTQADIDARRIVFRDNGTQSGSDRLIVTATDANGNALGTVRGEGDRTLFETGEYQASGGLDNINASAAYARGATGKDIKIAVVDSGIDRDHPDLDENVNTVQSVDIVDAMVGAAVSLDAISFGGEKLGNVGYGHAIANGQPFFGTFGDFSFMDIGQAQNLIFIGTADNATVRLTTDDGTIFEATGVDLSAGVDVATVALAGQGVNGTGKAIALEIDASAVTGTAAALGGPVDIKAIFDRTTNPTSGLGDDLPGTASSGHGTHVAGIIAAEKNDTGIHGVAYESEVVAIRVSRPDADPLGPINQNDLADAVDYAVSTGARIINLSLGASTTQIDQDLADAIGRAVNAGVVVVASAGNSSLQSPASPANYAIKPEAKGMLISVVATDDDDALASFSNRAGFVQDFTVAAPGVAILSAMAGGGDFELKSGTSMAAPMVSGALALIMDQFSELTGEEAANLLFTTTTDLGTAGVDDVFGRGLIDLERATLPQLAININIDSTNFVANAMNVPPGFATLVDASLLDLSEAYSGKLSIAAQSLTYRIGSGIAASDEISITIDAISAGTLGLAGTNITTIADAEEASGLLDEAFQNVALARTNFGASQNRLEIAFDTVNIMNENTEAARSEMMDLDVVAGILAFASQQLLLQTNVGMLGQAQQQAQILAQLLR